MLTACCLLALCCSPGAISLLLRSRRVDGGNDRPILGTDLSEDKCSVKFCHVVQADELTHWNPAIVLPELHNRLYGWHNCITYKKALQYSVLVGIVGILAQETDFESFQKFGSSYIAASYVKFIESAGARVVPIRLNRSDEEYNKIFYSINGILYPGGGVDLKTSEFSRVAKIFYRKALEANERGDYFPVWGTCLGHQLLSYLTCGENLLTWTNTDNFAFPLNFTKDAKGTKMFADFPDDLLQEMASDPVTSNFHFWSLSVQNFTNNEKLRSFYKVLTTNVHGNIEFISTMEAYAYPVYGVQWHPEKNPFEWNNRTGIPHSRSAMRVTYYIADFLVNEAQKSNHQFSSKKEEAEALIYNFNPVFTGRFSSFDQAYFFD
uniref:Uncharacterized protein n=1 Tax=Sphaerodactylus townsendi TaxID=933632 RepID=A0ACB8FDE4_9SAUR